MSQSWCEGRQKKSSEVNETKASERAPTPLPPPRSPRCPPSTDHSLRHESCELLRVGRAGRSGGGRRRARRRRLLVPDARGARRRDGRRHRIDQHKIVTDGARAAAGAAAAGAGAGGQLLAREAGWRRTNTKTHTGRAAVGVSLTISLAIATATAMAAQTKDMQGEPLTDRSGCRNRTDSQWTARSRRRSHSSARGIAG